MNPELKNKFVVVINGRTPRIFDSINNVKTFSRSEVKNWNWLIDVAPQYKEAAKEIFHTLIRPLTTLASIPPIPGNYDLGTAESPVLVSIIPEGKRCLDIQLNMGDLVALFYIYFRFIKKPRIEPSTAMKTLLEDPGIEFERASAIQLATLERHLQLLSEPGANPVIESASADLKEKINITLNDVTSFASITKDKLEQQRRDIDKYSESLDRKIKWQGKVWRRYLKFQLLHNNRVLQSAEQKVKDAENALKAHTTLRTSQTYWRSRKTWHITFKFGWLLTLGAIMYTTYKFLFDYTKNGGITGLLKINVEAGKSVPAATEISTNLATLTPNILGAVFIVTLMGIVIRIALNQFNSHSYLALQAAERVTFTDTFLALIQEGQIDADADRKLILESLFRSTQPNSIGDTPQFPTEILVKALTEKRPT